MMRMAKVRVADFMPPLCVGGIRQFDGFQTTNLDISGRKMTVTRELPPDFQSTRLAAWGATVFGGILA
jgi:hypothetical protein